MAAGEPSLQVGPRSIGQRRGGRGAPPQARWSLGARKAQSAVDGEVLGVRGRERAGALEGSAVRLRHPPRGGEGPESKGGKAETPAGARRPEEEPLTGEPPGAAGDGPRPPPAAGGRRFKAVRGHGPASGAFHHETLVSFLFPQLLPNPRGKAGHRWEETHLGACLYLSAPSRTPPEGRPGGRLRASAEPPSRRPSARTVPPRPGRRSSPRPDGTGEGPAQLGPDDRMDHVVLVQPTASFRPQNLSKQPGCGASSHPCSPRPAPRSPQPAAPRLPPGPAKDPERDAEGSSPQNPALSTGTRNKKNRHYRRPQSPLQTHLRPTDGSQH